MAGTIGTAGVAAVYDGSGAAGEVLRRLDEAVRQLSTTILGVGADELDPALGRALQLVGEACGAEHSTLFEFTHDEPPFAIAGSWARAGAVPGRAGADGGCRRWMIDRLAQGEQIRVAGSALPDNAADAREDPPRAALSSIGVPVTVAGRRAGALWVSSRGDGASWDGEIAARVRLFAEILVAAIHRGRQDRALRLRDAELTHLSTQLKSEARYLREELETLQGFPEIVGDAAPLREALDRVREVAATDATVLLLGETGTGKELFARAVHDRSPRRHRPLVRVNCAALPPTLIESELFGHERGAFTGAFSTRQGRFELADRGTIFLDEIGDLPKDLQAKLLRVLQHGEFERVGSSHIRRADVRVIAATHRDLTAAIAAGDFRADLF
jgi:transcriptional regulator with GAF, ATPase, and Fis domain